MSAKAGKKRSSPGADVAKNGDPFADVDIGEEDEKKLVEVQNAILRVELILERRAQETLIPVYQKRREAVKTIPKFWPVALLKHSIVSFHAQHDADKLALSHLEDLWIVRDAREPKVFTLEFYFKENPYFSDSVLKKEYRFEPSNASANEQADADGITPSMLDFSWDRDVTAQATKINWKDESKNLCKLYPLVLDEEDADQVADPGSFFNFFEVARDYNDLGVTIANEIFPDAIQYFKGDIGDELYSDEEEDSDTDGEDAEEIDLEKPRAKKAKNA
ncbi:hypothetical protein BV25DRAFT_1794156 [Artomyces pyxidatus]|uniref:Uncharacterized protein n=1 Tax=Artomyces pyxidatus TaxID=48021 RepID=A0ACB8THQ1_9AGAM|nr:hypothetical protein BV25DRAFT_1794156 [Artomyces pyxidatus]